MSPCSRNKQLIHGAWMGGACSACAADHVLVDCLTQWYSTGTILPHLFEVLVAGDTQGDLRSCDAVGTCYCPTDSALPSSPRTHQYHAQCGDSPTAAASHASHASHAHDLMTSAMSLTGAQRHMSRNQKGSTSSTQAGLQVGGAL